MDRGENQQAIEQYRRALAAFHHVGAINEETRALNGLGEALNAAGDVRQARAQHVAALALALDAHDAHQAERARAGIARCDEQG